MGGVNSVFQPRTLVHHLQQHEHQPRSLGGTPANHKRPSTLLTVTDSVANLRNVVQLAVLQCLHAKTNLWANSLAEPSSSIPVPSFHSSRTAITRKKPHLRVPEQNSVAADAEADFAPLHVSITDRNGVTHSSLHLTGTVCSPGNLVVINVPLRGQHLRRPASSSIVCNGNQDPSPCRWVLKAYIRLQR